MVLIFLVFENIYKIGKEGIRYYAYQRRDSAVH